MKNDFLEYYGRYNISPVKQDIQNIDIHFARRKKLYRQCGVPVLAFRDADVLEVGPGGGYNTLAFFQWNCRHVDLVEANETGRREMQKLFEKHAISTGQYKIFPCKIEDYLTDKKYDIVIAEGFLSHIYNQEEVINKLSGLVDENGIIVITCCDDVCFFIELMKRLVALFLTRNISDYNQKTEYLADFFKPQLDTLKGVSRSAKDWVQDQILNPAGVNGMELTMSQAVDYFGEAFDLLGCSPRMFTDYSWYKDIWYDCKSEIKEQFNRKRLSLLSASMPEAILPIETANILVQHFESIKKLATDYEKTKNICRIDEILWEMDLVEKDIPQNFDNEFKLVFCEIKEILYCVQREEELDMEKYPHFFSAFGRTLQYMSFVKK